MRRLARKDIYQEKNSKICLLHFKSEGLTDQKTRRKRKRETSSFIRRQRRKDACPLIFKDLLSYYTHTNHLVRSEFSTTSFRFENGAARYSFLNADTVKSFKDSIK